MKKLTAKQASEIKSRYYSEKISLRKLAKDYKVSHQAVYNIVNGASWSDTGTVGKPQPVKHYHDEGFEFLEW